jgi:hypothetical protein
MPYFVFKLFEHPVRRAEAIGEFARYPEASRFAKAQRAGLGDAACTVRIVFGANALEAEDMLLAPRAAPPRIGDDF